MKACETAAATRTIEMKLEIQAPVEAVWKALTDAEELTRWFPMKATVKPGAGGYIRQSWRDYWEGENPIEIWEPNRRLRLIWPTVAKSGSQLEADTAGMEPTSGPGGVPVAADFYLEGRGGVTVLRLVHSGFGVGGTWDEMYDGIRRGWNFELRGLRHYLEKHLGTPRLVVWARQALGTSVEEGWKRLMGREGLVREGSLGGKKEGDRYSITTATGDRMEGTVYVLDPPKDLCATVENMNGALLRLRLDNGCGSQASPEANFWVSCYGLSQKEVDAFEERVASLLRRLHPEAMKK